MQFHSQQRLPQLANNKKVFSLHHDLFWLWKIMFYSLFQGELLLP